jgi:hypothetical protein
VKGTGELRNEYGGAGAALRCVVLGVRVASLPVVVETRGRLSLLEVRMFDIGADRFVPALLFVIAILACAGPVRLAEYAAAGGGARIAMVWSAQPASGKWPT